MSGDTKPRILVIRGGAIGDFILTLPAIGLLREAFPDAHLEILGYEHIVSIANGRFYADSTKSIEYGAMAGFFVRNGTLPTDLSEYFASFQQIVSYLFDPDGIFEANLRRAGVKNFLSAYSKIDDSEHASRQLARPLQSMALFLDEGVARLHLTDQDMAAADELLRGVRGEKAVAIHPGSGSQRKNWPLAHWQELIRRLIDDHCDVSLVLVGGESDRQQIGQLRQALPSDRVVIVEDRPLPEVAAILSRCELFLGHDSGISHLAAAAGTSCVLLFGPTDPEIWAPLAPNVAVIASPEGQLEKLPVEAVYPKVAESLR